VLQRVGLSRLKEIEPAEPVRRYERERPGEMIHIDIKKLGRFQEVGHRITGDRTRQSSRRGKAWGAGWEFVHVAIDDASRIAFSPILPDEKAALAYYASLGITVERVMTDNGPCYTSKAFARACRRHGLKHVRTRPYTPKTNERPNASSRPPSGSGPLPSPIPTRTGAPRNCHSGFIATIGTDHTAA
jgi:transposase InsO family protein